MTAETVDFADHLGFSSRVGVGLARRLNAPGLDDAEQDAAIGMFEASRRYDPSLGVPFEAYALRRIRGSVVDGIRQRTWWSRMSADAPQPRGNVEILETIGVLPGVESFEDDLIDLLTREWQREWILGHADILTDRQASVLRLLMDAASQVEVARQLDVTEAAIHQRMRSIIERLRPLASSECRHCRSSYHAA